MSRSYPAFVAAALALLWSVPVAHARKDGVFTAGCEGCHKGSQATTFDVSIEPATVEPGEEVTITAIIGASGAKVGGISVNFPGGEFEAPEDDLLVVSGDWITHNQPKPATDGQIQFQMKWLAPASPGSLPYSIAALAGNGDNRSSGDAYAVQFGTLAVGCEIVTMYRDNDRDGFGVATQTLMECPGRDGYTDELGDCDDLSATAYPGAPELCNGVDDDCDGEVDEDVVDQYFYPDLDGDGFGTEEGAIVDCAPPEGYVSNALDCDGNDPGVSPDAEEICDSRDNDCDGRTDEDVIVYCGVGECQRQSALCILSCTPGYPVPEVCNGLDDDCDGEIDEGLEGGCDDVAPTPPPVDVAPPSPDEDAGLQPASEAPTAGTSMTEVSAPEAVGAPAGGRPAEPASEGGPASVTPEGTSDTGAGPAQDAVGASAASGRSDAGATEVGETESSSAGGASVDESSGGASASGAAGGCAVTSRGGRPWPGPLGVGFSLLLGVVGARRRRPWVRWGCPRARPRP